MTLNKNKTNHALIVAQAFLNENKLSEALKCLNTAFNQRPADPVIAREFSRLCERAGRPADAIQILQTSVTQGNQDPESLYMLGTRLYLTKRDHEASLVVKTLIKLKPDSYDAHNLMGHIYLRNHQPDKAKEAFQKANSIEPSRVDAINNLAWVQVSMGQIDSALSNFKHVIEHDPLPTDAIFGHSMFAPTPKLLETIDVIESKSELSEKQRAELGFAKGRIFDAQKDYEKAFLAYQSANSAWSSTHPYNPDKEIRFFNELKERQLPLIKNTKLTPKNGRSEYKDDETLITPIFIVGLPRSSTTLIEQILASHSQIDAAGELNYFPALANSALSQLNQVMTEQTPLQLKQIAKSYLQKLKQHSSGKPYIVDKLPQNFLYLGLIRACLPHAKIIHCQRNPLDNAISLFKHHFPVSNHHYAYSLDDISHYIQTYKALMSFWRENKIEYYDCQYELLVSETDTSIKNLLAYCGVKFEEACLNYYQTKRTIRTASAQQVRSPINSESLDQWRHYETHLNRLITNLQSYS